MRILAIIPAYNEEKSIYNVIKSIRLSSPNVDIAVIDDGSKDNTYLEAKRAGCFVIKLAQNLGIGGAVQTGYIYAKENNYDIAIQVDGDGQHNPEDISKLIKVIENNEADMAIGSRFVDKTGYRSSIMRKIGIDFFSKLVSIICRENFYDTTSGYRAINRKGIELFAEYYPKDYPEVEAIVYAKKRGIRIKEVPVNMNERQGGRSSITPMKSIYYMIKVTCVLLLQPPTKTR